VNILNKQSRTADKGWSSSLVAGRVANNIYSSVRAERKCTQNLGRSLGERQLGRLKRRWEYAL